MSGLPHQQPVLYSEQPGSASLGKAEGLQFSNSRRTWLRDPDAELLGPCEHEGGKLLWGNRCLSLTAPASLMVAYPPHFPISTEHDYSCRWDTSLSLSPSPSLSQLYTQFLKDSKKAWAKTFDLGGRTGRLFLTSTASQNILLQIVRI